MKYMTITGGWQSGHVWRPYAYDGVLGSKIPQGLVHAGEMGNHARLGFVVVGEGVTD